MLIKGWAVSRLYPEGIVRPAGDIDLVVRDEDYERAKTLLAGTALSLHQDRGPKPVPDEGATLGLETGVDLHSFSRWYGASHPRFFADAERAPVGDTTVLVPRPEDHLRALCLHFLRHGAVRPLRLVDIALLVERLAGVEVVTSDWDRLRDGKRREREQVDVSLRLAKELLGASLDGVTIPAEVRDGAMPSWLVPAVLTQWRVHAGDRLPFVEKWRKSGPQLGLLVERMLPDPITATISMGMPFGMFPRLPIRLAALPNRVYTFLSIVLWQGKK